MYDGLFAMEMHINLYTFFTFALQF